MPGIERRVSGQNIGSLFERVRHRRHALVEPGKPWRFPMDDALSLPADLYSYSVRRRVYEERVQAANDTVSDKGLLLMSSDGAAVRVIEDALREPTRPAAEKAQKENPAPPRGDPTARPTVKPHQTRRAVVTAVWEQEPHERTAADIVANLHRDPSDPESRKNARGPNPQRKRLTASIEQDMSRRSG